MDTLIEPALPSLLAVMHPSVPELATAYRRLHRKALVIALLLALSYWGLVFLSVGTAVRCAFAVAMAVSLVALATGVMHDANHGAWSSSLRLNHVMGWSADVLGASSLLWRIKHHGYHHGSPNTVGMDADIEQLPFARLTDEQPWRWWHRGQRWYMWPLYGLLGVQWLVASDFATIRAGTIVGHRFRRPLRRRDVVGVVVGKLVHITWAIVVPLMLHPWWGVLVVYLAISWTVGFVLANMFQLAHCVEEAEFFSAGDQLTSFELRQLHSTVDVRCGVPALRPAMRWIMGGLDHQIEHHLAPRLPHTVYRVIAPRLALECAQRDVPYRMHPTVIGALRSHARLLGRMGKRPSQAAGQLLSSSVLVTSSTLR